MKFWTNAAAFLIAFGGLHFADFGMVLGNWHVLASLLFPACIGFVYGWEGFKGTPRNIGGTSGHPSINQHYALYAIGVIINLTITAGLAIYNL